MRLVHLLTFGIGAILGIAGTLVLLPSVEPLSTATVATTGDSDPTAELKRLRGLLDQKEASLAETTTELVNLRSQLELATEERDAARTLLDMRDPGNAEEQREKIRQEAMERGVRRFSDRRTDDLRQRFNLNDEQLAAARAYFEKRSEFRIAEMSARRNGEEPPAPWDGPSTREALAAILDPDQFAAYAEYTDAVQTSRSETRATARMNAIAPDLSLSEPQKDLVYALYYGDTLTQFDDGAEAPTREQRDTQLDAGMQAILTPEQYAQWQQMEADQTRRRGRGRDGPGF